MVLTRLGLLMGKKSNVWIRQLPLIRELRRTDSGSDLCGSSRYDILGCFYVPNICYLNDHLDCGTVLHDLIIELLQG